MALVDMLMSYKKQLQDSHATMARWERIVHLGSAFDDGSDPLDLIIDWSHLNLIL